MYCPTQTVNGFIGCAHASYKVGCEASVTKPLLRVGGILLVAVHIEATNIG